MPKNEKKDARELFNGFIEQVRLYCAEEGIGPHDPLTLDTLAHAALFVDGKPAKKAK